jgi:hypothetical protein
MSTTKTHQHSQTLGGTMKHVTCFIVVMALVIGFSTASMAQDQTAPDKLVKLFKTYLNNSNVTGMTSLLMDIDIDGIPMQSANYPRLVDAMSTYITAWRNQNFTLLKQVQKGSSEGVVYMYCAATRNQIKFYVERIKVGKDWKWFIADTEIFENISSIGDEGGEDIG